MNILLSGNLHWFYPKIPKEKQTFQKNIIAHPIVINQIPVFIKKVLNPAGFKLFLLKNGCWSNENPFLRQKCIPCQTFINTNFHVKVNDGLWKSRTNCKRKSLPGRNKIAEWETIRDKS